MPVTARARRAIASVRMPPPQPTSSTSYPRPAGDVADPAEAQRIDLVRGRNSLVGSHHDARRPRTSRARPDRRWRACRSGGHRINAQACAATCVRWPPAHLRRALQAVRSFTILTPRNPNVGDGAAVRRVHEMRDRIEYRCVAMSREVDRDDVRILAGEQEPITARAPTRACPMQGRHRDEPWRRAGQRHCRSRPSRSKACEAHLGEEVEAIVRRGRHPCRAPRSRLLAKVATGNAAALPAAMVRRDGDPAWGTRVGARRCDRLLLPGKDADIVAVDFADIAHAAGIRSGLASRERGGPQRVTDVWVRALE